MKKQLASLFLLGAALGGVGCTAEITGNASSMGSSGPGPGSGSSGSSGSGPGSSPSGGTAPTAECNVNASLAAARVSLLTDAEYTNTMRDVFGVDFVPEAAAVETGEYQIDEFASVASVDVLKQYYRAADQVASKVKPCGEAALDAACVESWLRQKIPRAWKRSVTDQEIAGLMAIFNGGLADGTVRAVTLLMEAALGSGSFLYRTEIGADASGTSGSVAMTPYELANAVSFALLDTVPDDQLWAKATDGTITQPAVLSAEVDRLLAGQPARDNLTKKVGYFLNIEKIAVVSKDVPEYTATLKSALYQSAEKFLNDLVWGGQLSDLFTSNKYYANQEIARVYGLPATPGTDLVQVDLPAERNAGILSHPGLLATTNAHTGTDDIVHRGLWIYQNLACGTPVGAPPATAQNVADTLTGTQRERSEQRDALPQCGACHKFFDPFGFASESFDVIGRYRTIDPEDGKPVVSSSTIQGLGDDLDGSVSSLKDIADRLKTGRRVADCATTHLAEYALAHNPASENSCALRQIKDNFATSGKFVDLFKAILTSPAFATRDLRNQ